MDATIDLLRVLHIAAAMLMAWPYYGLAAVNQRVRLGPPLGDRTDRYMENILKNRTTACLLFQFPILAGRLPLPGPRVPPGQPAPRLHPHGPAVRPGPGWRQARSRCDAGL